MRNPAKQKAAAHRHYLRNKEAMKARAAAWNEKQRKILAGYIEQLKSSTPCADCGRKFPSCAMDFDHVRGKKSCNVANMISQAYSLERLREEIAKCDIVCANCHRIRTHR